MDTATCFRCGAELTPLAEIPLDQRIELEQNYRERFPNTWDEVSDEDKIRVCDPCDEDLNAIESPEQYELRKVLEDGDDGFTTIS